MRWFLSLSFLFLFYFCVSRRSHEKISSCILEASEWISRVNFFGNVWKSQSPSSLFLCVPSIDISPPKWISFVLFDFEPFLRIIGFVCVFGKKRLSTMVWRQINQTTMRSIFHQMAFEICAKSQLITSAQTTQPITWTKSSSTFWNELKLLENRFWNANRARRTHTYCNLVISSLSPFLFLTARAQSLVVFGSKKRERRSLWRLC